MKPTEKPAPRHDAPYKLVAAERRAKLALVSRLGKAIAPLEAH